MFRLQVYHQQSKIHVTIQSQSRIVKNQTIQHRDTEVKPRQRKESTVILLIFSVSLCLCVEVL